MYIAELITSNDCINRIYIEKNKITTKGAKLILQALKSNSSSSITLLEFESSSINEKVIDAIKECLWSNKSKLTREAKELYEKGYSSYKEGKYSEAIEKYNAGLRKDEDSFPCKEGLKKAKEKYAEQLKLQHIPEEATNLENYSSTNSTMEKDLNSNSDEVQLVDDLNSGTQILDHQFDILVENNIVQEDIIGKPFKPQKSIYDE